MSEHAQVSRAALGILGTRAGIYPVKIVVALLVAPLLGTANYGIYSFLILPGSVLLPLMSVGTGIGVRYQISSEEYRAQDVAFMGLILGLVNGLVTALFFGLLWQFDLLGETGRAISYELILPVLLVLPLAGAAQFMNRVIVGGSWFSAMNLFIFLNNLAPPAFLFAFVIVGGQGVVGAVASIVASAILLAVVSIALVWVRFRPRLRIEFRFLRLAVSYGFRAWIGTLASRASIRLDQFVVGFVESPGALGIYRIAVMIAEMLWMVPDAVNIPLFNRVSRTASLKERVDVVSRSHRLLIAVVTVLALAMFAVCWWAIPLVLGVEYIDARWLLGLLIPGAVALVTPRFLGMFFNASGKPEKASFIQVVGAIASLVGYLTLIPWLGVSGAAIATSIAYIVTAVTARRMFVSAAGPNRVRLFRATRADVKWANSLVRDSLSIWRDRVRGET